MITTEIHEAGLDGVFARADGDQPLRAVLALGGSDGGVPAYWARLLAQERFASLAVAYFNTPNTQPALTEVPLERLERALRWLREQPGVATNDGRVGVIGVSKGAELALLLAVTFPDLVGAVVAYTPSSVVWQGIDFSTQFPPLRSSWSLGGRPLPFVPYPAGVPPTPTAQGMSLLPIYDRGLDSVAGDAAVIPVERAVGPLLLVSGGGDRMWPAERMCRMLVDRMGANGRKRDVRHINFPDAGHVLFPYAARGADEGDAPPMPYDLGGSPAAAQQAHAIAWPEVVRTLQGD
jgi:dienelactone hydrolase